MKITITGRVRRRWCRRVLVFDLVLMLVAIGGQNQVALAIASLATVTAIIGSLT
jgi:hypothetical protein